MGRREHGRGRRETGSLGGGWSNSAVDTSDDGSDGEGEEEDGDDHDRAEDDG